MLLHTMLLTGHCGISLALDKMEGPAVVAKYLGIVLIPKRWNVDSQLEDLKLWLAWTEEAKSYNCVSCSCS